MSENKINQIHILVNDAIRAYMKSEFSASIQCAKKCIEQICLILLIKSGVSPEVYNEKTNRHTSWGLEKLIRECEEKDLLDGALCAELLLVKDWRNNLEHTNDSLKLKGFAVTAIEVIRKLYGRFTETYNAKPIEHWPDNLQTNFGSMLPFSPTGITAADGQLVIQGPGGQRLCLDFINDGASWTDEDGNKKYYKGNISESNKNKGWIG